MYYICSPGLLTDEDVSMRYGAEGVYFGDFGWLTCTEFYASQPGTIDYLGNWEPGYDPAEPYCNEHDAAPTSLTRDELMRQLYEEGVEYCLNCESLFAVDDREAHAEPCTGDPLGPVRTWHDQQNERTANQTEAIPNINREFTSASGQRFTWSEIHHRYEPVRQPPRRLSDAFEVQP